MSYVSMHSSEENPLRVKPVVNNLMVKATRPQHKKQTVSPSPVVPNNLVAMMPKQKVKRPISGSRKPWAHEPFMLTDMKLPMQKKKKAGRKFTPSSMFLEGGSEDDETPNLYEKLFKQSEKSSEPKAKVERKKTIHRDESILYYTEEIGIKIEKTRM